MRRRRLVTSFGSLAIRQGSSRRRIQPKEHFLPYRLAEAGYPSLTMNTLLANLGLFFGFGVFADTMVQIDAACEFLKQRGYPRIVIAGHGLGGCIAIRYATSSRGASYNSAIVGVIAIATPYSMPDMVRRRW